jgi:hypothetical protein
MSLLAVTFTNHSTALHYSLLFHIPTDVGALEPPQEQYSRIMYIDVAALYLILKRVYIGIVTGLVTCTSNLRDSY